MEASWEANEIVDHIINDEALYDEALRLEGRSGLADLVAHVADHIASVRVNTDQIAEAVDLLLECL